MKDQRVLAHIREAINDIEEYTSVGRDRFMADRMRQDAVIRKLEIIGEAVKQLTDTTKQSPPEFLGSRSPEWAIDWLTTISVLISHWFGELWNAIYAHSKRPSKHCFDVSARPDLLAKGARSLDLHSRSAALTSANRTYRTPLQLG